MKRLSIIVPCYNEEETIKIYYDEAIKYFTNENYDYKIIFVNDGSKDKSYEIMQELANLDDRVLYINLSRNFGKEAAMFAGLEAAKRINSDCAMFMDVDLQDPPKMIPEMIEYYESGYNLIMTKHKDRNGQSFLKKVFSNAFYKVYAFLTKDKGMKKGSRDFCLMDKKVIESFLQFKDYERFTKGIFHFVGFRTKMIEFDYSERVAGTTKWSFKKLLRYAFLGIREFSRFYEYIPKIIAWLFFFLFCYDIGKGIYDAVNYNMNFFNALNWDHIRFDVAMILIFVVLFYIMRLIYDVRYQVQNRPIYISEDDNLSSVKDLNDDEKAGN